MSKGKLILVILGVVLMMGSSLLSVGAVAVHVGEHSTDGHSYAVIQDATPMSYKSYVDHKDELMKKHMSEGDYACCLASPCASCLELDPYHGEEATCHCLKDIVNGEGPCDECVGGILSGRGNTYLVSYFVDAVTDKLGEKHRETIASIIAESYND